MAKRIADRRLLSLVECFLKAGVMEGCLFKRSVLGTPQGGICSPLLTNIYLHQLDLYWWNKYGNLHRKEKERRRRKHLGNCALIRYADDFVRHEARIVHGAVAPAASRRAANLSP
jgi:retron-type reverse transcriptase